MMSMLNFDANQSNLVPRISAIFSANAKFISPTIERDYMKT